MTETYRYDAFGTLTSIQSMNENGVLAEAKTALSKFLYAGEQYDTVTGFYYLRARQYDTAIGRFTQEDTYLGDGRNLYVYVRNNPLKYVDPSGHGKQDTNDIQKDENDKKRTTPIDLLPWLFLVDLPSFPDVDINPFEIFDGNSIFDHLKFGGDAEGIYNSVNDINGTNDISENSGGGGGRPGTASFERNTDASGGRKPVADRNLDSTGDRRPIADRDLTSTGENRKGNQTIVPDVNGTLNQTQEYLETVVEGGSGSKFQEVFDLADDYTLSDDTFNNHILDRHGPDSIYGNKSHFNADFDIRNGIDSTLTGDNFVAGSNTAGREGYIFEQTFTNPIGTNSKGKPLYTLKVVIDEAGNVITAFPK